MFQIIDLPCRLYSQMRFLVSNSYPNIIALNLRLIPILALSVVT